MNRLTILGPQRPVANVAPLVDQQKGDGEVVVITAGWRQEEIDDEVVRRILGPKARVLPLYNWFEVLMKDQPDLKRDYRARQKALIAQKEAQRVRLHAALGAWSKLQQMQGAMCESACQQALDDVRQIDEQLLFGADAIRAIHGDIGRCNRFPAVNRMIDRAEEILCNAKAVLIAGGHVGVLANRLAFFEIGGALTKALNNGVPVYCWSAGAMALSERIVLYYDDPPEGPSWPEVLDRGLGLIKDVVVLPHAHVRLRLSEKQRMKRLSQRFLPARAIGMENGAHLELHDGEWRSLGAPNTAFEITTDGSVVPVRKL